MTEQQQLLILNLYKQGKTYKEIWELTKISPHSVASFIRRKHKNLQTLRQMSRRKTNLVRITELQDKFKIPEYQAQAIYDSISSRFETKRHNAQTQGRTFTVQLIDIVIPITCPLLGIPLDYFAENYRANNYPTFDRIDNTLDYIPGNVHIVSWRGNRLKGDGTPEEHEKIAAYLRSLDTRREASREGYTK